MQVHGKDRYFSSIFLLKKKLHVTWMFPKIRVIARNSNEFMRYNSRIKSHERYPPGYTLSYSHLWSDAVHNNQFRHTPDRFTIRGIRRDSIQTRYKSRSKFIPQTAILLKRKLITINRIKDIYIIINLYLIYQLVRYKIFINNNWHNIDKCATLNHSLN